MQKLLAGDPKFKINFQDQCKNYIKELNSKFKAKFREAWLSVEKLVVTAPVLYAPPKMVPELPVVGIVTLFYNRPEWFAHAVRNLLTCDYPRDKLVWVIVDDSDAALRVDLKVEQARRQLPDLNIQYVSCSRRLSVGEKRNRGVALATASAAASASSPSVIAFMDDDDHYPKASLMLRVLWLLNSKRGAVYCSTLPMYDITKYISAINVPPLNLSPSKRVSEASMCFTREFWLGRKFPDVSVAEGEGFIAGRELDTVEIPPEGVIVSFLHGKNSTSRRVPEQKEANGCHYGFSDEYFTMISQIAATAAAP
jgi:cellulose synthase/poly-beta-1,6-N-acetylglucosamine synthase-like glycosyltransferase